MEPSNSSAANRSVIIAIVVVLCCLCVLLLALGGGLYYYFSRNLGDLPSLPIPADTTPTPEPTIQVNRPPADQISKETEEKLARAMIPESDLYDLACRLKNICDVPHTLPAPSTPYKVGDKKQFWLSNSETAKNFQVETTLRYITPHSYFWLQDGVHANDEDIKALMDAFETKIYPTDREFFGSEWTPGVDNDPHIYILYVRGIGQNTGGYFSTPDEYNPAVFKYSNGHEQFVFNADGESLTDEYTYGTLAHEFQHMIHWNLDRNETSWINEGFSEVAAFLNGYTVGMADYAYAQAPDVPLTYWTDLSSDPDITTKHYGQAFLFLTYFLDRFGEKATQAVVKDPENGLQSLDDVLTQLKISDPQTGKPITADDVVLDWMAAMYLHDASIGDGRYAYHNYPNAPQSPATVTISTCPRPPYTAAVSEYGADYIEITCAGDHTLSFTGSTAVQVPPADAHGGRWMYWSNSADESDTTLTREFDLTGVTGSVDFSYWTWYDLEEGYDYLYLEASTDGQHWDILKTTSCTEKDESGNSYGCAYNAKSGGWERSELDQ